jgi:glycosyltransferase involved in cell wall biosynthesis
MPSGNRLAVGLNLLYLVEGSAGAGRYGLELLGALKRVEPQTRVAAFVGRDASERLFSQPWSSEIEWVRLPVRVTNRTHLLAQMLALPALAAQRSLDVLHSPANIGPPAAPRVARVVTLLDLIWLHQREAWDATRAGRGMGALSRSSARRADRVIAISNAARDDFVANLGLDPSRIDVTPLGVNAPTTAEPEPEREAKLRRSLGLDGAQVILCVAQKRPYKNLGALVRAAAQLEERPLIVLVGAPTPHEEELRRLAAELGVQEQVRFVGWLSEAELEAIYRLATCLVLPSLMEGFGLPVLEAMARDIPVACSDRTAMAEVAGDAALLFDPDDQQAVTESIRRLLRDRELASSLVQRGRERVRLFTWERTAAASFASYTQAVADKRSSGRR